MNTDKYILQEVTTSAQEREWLDLPKKIYKGNRNWVCPLDQDITEVFDPARNELFAEGEAVRWVVRNRAGEVVGRIAAFYNREKAAIEEQPTGGCGFFEAIDDQQVADMMFDASRMWLASRGMEAMDGPINFGQRRDWWGLLVEGYEFQPLYKNPYNPPYYKELFENYGFKNYFNQHSFIWRANVSEASERIFDRAERLLSTPGYHVENIDMNNLEDADWENNWKQFYKPMEIGERLIVVPEWEQANTQGRIPLILNPGLTFGTGSHATTRLCLTALEETIHGGERVLDLGCGSGILSIAALRLGAEHAFACDIDEKCVEVAYENAALNGIDRSRYTVRWGDVLSDQQLKAEIGGGYDMVVANIVADVIIGLSGQVRPFLKEGGLFLCSGIIDDRAEEVARHLREAGWDILRTRQSEGWFSYLCR